VRESRIQSKKAYRTPIHLVKYFLPYLAQWRGNGILGGYLKRQLLSYKKKRINHHGTWYFIKLVSVGVESID